MTDPFKIRTAADDVRDEARRAERAAVVKYLRAAAARSDRSSKVVLSVYASRIEKGEHLP